MNLKDITKRANAVLSISEMYAIAPSITDSINELNEKKKKIETTTKKYQDILVELGR